MSNKRIISPWSHTLFQNYSVKSDLPATTMDSLTAVPFPHELVFASLIGTAVTNQVFSHVGCLDLNWSLQNKNQSFLLQLQAVASKSLYIHFEPEVQTEQQIQFKHIHLSRGNSSNSPVVCIVEKTANKMYPEKLLENFLQFIFTME
jgi:hypothetical protein